MYIYFFLYLPLNAAVTVKTLFYYGFYYFTIGLHLSRRRRAVPTYPFAVYLIFFFLVLPFLFLVISSLV